MERYELTPQQEKLAQRKERTLRKQPGITLTSQEVLLAQEDELKFLQANQEQYNAAVVQSKAIVDMMNRLSSCGFSEEQLRTLYLQSASIKSVAESFGQMILQLTPAQSHQLTQQAKYIKLDQTILSQSSLYRDEDDGWLSQAVKEGSEIPMLELLREVLRTREETLALLNMQVKYLKDKKRQERKEQQKAQQPIEVLSIQDTPEQEGLEILPVSSQELATEVQGESFLLSDWQVFWTNVSFSIDQNHTIPLPTESRNKFLEAVVALKAQNAGFSIKPASIVAALEFHLRRDVLQRAFAARMRYGPEETREWIKIKRGDDRILLRFPENQANTLIFFAAGRDVVYRGL